MIHQLRINMFVVSLDYWSQKLGFCREAQSFDLVVLYLLTESTPAITQPLVDKSVVEGEKTRLECVLSKEAQEVVVWFKGKEPVQPGGRYEIASDGKRQTLVIHGFKAEDQGSYTCMASPDIKTSATLSVEGTLDFLFHHLHCSARLSMSKVRSRSLVA